METFSGTESARNEAARMRRRQMSKLAMMGAVAGLAVTLVGVFMLAYSASVAQRDIALVSIVAPVVIYVAWWVLGSGFWRDYPAVSDIRSEASAAVIEQVFDTDPASEAAVDFRATIAHGAVDQASAAELRASLGSRPEGDTAARSDLRPRRSS